MHDESRKSQWAILLVVLSALSLCSANGYCERYASCQQRVEVEERRCVKLGEKLNRSNTQCLRLVDMARTAVDGLQLRKTELERDCATKNNDNQSWSLRRFQQSVCKRATQSIHKSGKFSTKIGRQHNNIKICRRSAQLLRKKCHMLARCCSLHSCSGLRTIRSQISSAIAFLHHLKRKCLKQKSHYHM
ncbi:hypothetical protein LOAG_05667 [Loa loa]|uniref:Secreted protein n=1 Tax=Loa loa TaxID=7209 RepID=A0A1I7VRV4_LOALO|nr:hypothetical protein LOAG_05667 [Loa loa]EFO22819.2 hypothetical protein LOAG_05667 [Loa loa]